MTTRQIFASKAQKYARYRWDYAPEAIRAILEIAQINPCSSIADLGAGTGSLTRHFAGQAGLIYAVEINEEMIREAQRRLSPFPNVMLVQAGAECIPLPNRSVELVTVGTAIHWFDPEPAREEIRRILKPGGWLAVLYNNGIDAEPGFYEAIDATLIPENGVDRRNLPARPSGKQEGDYFGSAGYQKLVFPFSFHQGWEAFFGALCSRAFTPDEDHPRFAAFERAAREVFDRFFPDGVQEVRGETELLIGGLQ